MEYIYAAMFLQEMGKEINEDNVKKIFSALHMEAEADKLQLFIPALSILSCAKSEKIKKYRHNSFFQQFTGLQKRFDSLRAAMLKDDGRPSDMEREKDRWGCSIDGEKLGGSEDGVCMDDSVCTDSVCTDSVCTHDVCTEHSAVTEDEGEEPASLQDSGQSDLTIKCCREKSVHVLPARYVYGVTCGGANEGLGAIGLGGAEVYTIPYMDISAVVHDCDTVPYQSDDETVVKDWLFTQQEVLDVVMNKFGVVLPMSFDMIIEENGQKSPEQVVEGWLEENYQRFGRTIEKVKNKQEFGVQVVLDTEDMGKSLLESDEALRDKRHEIDCKPQGAAYMEREMLKDLLKEKIEERADLYFKEFYGRIRNCVEDVVIEKAKKVGGNKQMIMNLSCLVDKDRLKDLGRELEKIEANAFISVRFSGPWAPYSFVAAEKGGQ